MHATGDERAVSSQGKLQPLKFFKLFKSSSQNVANNHNNIMLNFQKMFQVLLFTTLNFFCLAENIHTSTESLGGLINTENHIYEYIDNVIQQMQLLRDIFESYKIKFVHHENATEEYILKYVANPLNSFALIKRLTIDLGELNRIHNETIEDINNMFFKNSDKIYPSKGDLTGISLLLKELQEGYFQNITDFTNGYINGIKYRDPLSSEEVFHLGNAMCADRHLPECTDWLRESLRKWKNDEVMSKIEIMEAISEIYYYTNNSNASLEWDNKILKEDPDNIDTLLHKAKILLEAKYGRNESDYEDSSSYFGQDLYKPEQIKKFNSLCSGQLQLPEKIKLRLHCFYKYGKHPFLRIAPLKMELLYDKPVVYLVYDMNKATERKEIIQTAKIRLVRSKVVDRTGKSMSSIRISSTAAFDNTEPFLSRFVQRNLDLTDLEWAAGVNVQVTHYPPGGFFKPHHDMAPTGQARKFFRSGNRIATVLHYLSDVEQGGSTAFHDMGIMVKPQKGTAVYWRNLHSSGEPDYRTFHGGCPVLMGIKWVSNVWIHEKGQVKVTCDLKYLSEKYNVTALSEYQENMLK